ncbi:MAG TPA: hypothetical protein VK272_13030 [Solirubrobacteraceae bacterium]|nr:hypothetical protein [Solirubrobacteraceae bacterium]
MDFERDNPEESPSLGPSDAELDRVAADLDLTSESLSKNGNLLLALTLLNLLILIAVVIRSTRYVEWYTSSSAALLSLLLTVAAILRLAIFERTRRRGDSLEEEISEELQWSLRSSISKEPRRPPISIRLALREYRTASKLPLLPRYVDIPLLAMLNISCGLASLVVTLTVHTTSLY